MKKKLAIVIPAYKADFFKATLSSIANQTCKDFTVYIGDDNSPNQLKEIVDAFAGDIDIVYKKFGKNLGGTDLVAQWDRCIDLVQDEEWVWFFSDDDTIMDNCVERFYTTLATGTKAKLFHFDVKIIDADGNIINEPASFPVNLMVPDFHLKKWRSEISTYVVEYIFSKDCFKEKKGFQNFDYAWHSDEATWTKLGYPDSIVTISEAFVYWRRSNVNITPDNSSPKVVYGKINADIKFAAWVFQFYKENSLGFTFSHKFYLAKRFVNHLAMCNKVLKTGEWKSLLKQQLEILDFKSWYGVFNLYYYFRLKKFK